jgi:hypothetical protein
MKVTVEPGSKSTFSIVRDRTNDMVSHTMMLNGVSIFLFSILATTFFELSLASRLASSLTSNTGNASSTVGFPVGILLVTLGLGKGNAFPAVKVSGLFLLINPLIFLVLLTA